MKRVCVYCGMFEDEDGILACCQGPDCSLRSAHHESPGVFHGRCAAALGRSGGARWQNCPWRPTAFRSKPDTATSAIEDLDGSEEEKYFCSMTQLEEENYAARIIQRRWRWTRKRIEIRAAWEEKLQEKLREARRRLVAALSVGAQRQEKDGNSQGDASHLSGRGGRVEKALNKVLAILELDLRFLSRRVDW